LRKKGVEKKGIKERACKILQKGNITNFFFLKDIIRNKEPMKELLREIARRKDMKKRAFEKDHKKKRM